MTNRDKRTNARGEIELLCYFCNQWKTLAMENWAFFPEDEHECRMCYDKVHAEEYEDYEVFADAVEL